MCGGSIESLRQGLWFANALASTGDCEACAIRACLVAAVAAAVVVAWVARWTAETQHDDAALGLMGLDWSRGTRLLRVFLVVLAAAADRCWG